MQIIKKLFCSHFSVNKGLIEHVVQSCYNYITFRKLEIHTVKMRPISACYTSGRGARHFLGIGRCTIKTLNDGACAVVAGSLFHNQTILGKNLKSQVCLLELYSKQPILGLTQEFCWVRAGVRPRVAFETINYRDEVSERRKVIVH